MKLMMIAVAAVSIVWTAAFAAGSNKDLRRYEAWCLDNDMDARLRATSCTRLLQAGKHNSLPEKVLFMRGLAHTQLNEFDAAILDFTEALAERPGFAPAHNRRGLAYMYKKMYAQAVDDFKTAIRLKPNYDAPMNNLAWIYATADDPEFRRPTEALYLMKNVRWLSDSPRIRDTLAAAYAANGDFEMAIINQKLAISMLMSFNQSHREEEFEQRLALYQRSLPVWAHAQSEARVATAAVTPTAQ